jgi:hypothetical protein
MPDATSQPQREHWLVRFGLARRSGPGPISLRDGMNADWSAGNWQFTTAGAVMLFAASLAIGLFVAVVGRWTWTQF